MVEPVRKTIEVKCDPATAFSIFAEQTSDWWPLDAHSVSAMSGKTARSVTIEPRAGGRVYETTPDGTSEPWGWVEVWQPAQRLKIFWHVMRDPEQATEVDVVFSLVEGGTRVDLIHSGWEKLGDEAQKSRDGYDSGWVGVFVKRYAAACAA